MPKFTPQEDGSFLVEMIQSDAQEERITEAVQMIFQLATAYHDKPHDADARRKERGGYRYCELERALMLIRGQADDALKHIKFLDFPELVKPEGEA